MEIMKIIIIFNYVVSKDFLGLGISIEQPKFQSKFKGTSIDFDLNWQLDAWIGKRTNISFLVQVESVR
jgi:hypothetical protein